MPVPDPGGGLRRYRGVVGYDGSGFHGWARQPGLATVEEAIADAIRAIARAEPVGLTCAGRTDAGVHARGQVIHFDAVELDAARAQRGLNAVLPPQVRIRSLEPAPPGFDARFSALWRRYRYRVCDGVPDPLERQQVLAVNGPLDVAAMDEAAARLVGLHDFGSFCKPRAGATARRTILGCSWRRIGGLAVLDIRADAFCHSMVRSIAGACLEVGLGRRPVGWPGELLAVPSRNPAAPVAPPHGLVLEEVGYPPDELLASRAAATRQRRAEAVPGR